MWGYGFILYWKRGQALYWSFIYSACEARIGAVWEGSGAVLQCILVQQWDAALWQHLFESRIAAAPYLLEHQQNPPTTPVTPSIINDYLLHRRCIIFTVGTSCNNMHETAMQGSIPLPREAQARRFLYVQSTETSSYVAGLEPQQPRIGGCQVQSCWQKVSSLKLVQDLSRNLHVTSHSRLQTSFLTQSSETPM